MTKDETDPKACEWELTYVVSAIRYRAIVFDYVKGLTAFESWQRSKFEGNPHFSQVHCRQMTPYPFPSYCMPLPFEMNGLVSRGESNASNSIQESIPELELCP